MKKRKGQPPTLWGETDDELSPSMGKGRKLDPAAELSRLERKLADVRETLDAYRALADRAEARIDVITEELAAVREGVATP